MESSDIATIAGVLLVCTCIVIIVSMLVNAGSSRMDFDCSVSGVSTYINASNVNTTFFSLDHSTFNCKGSVDVPKYVLDKLN